MRSALLTAGLMLLIWHVQAITYLYFQNNSSTAFTVTSTQTGTHILDADEWWYTNTTVQPWQSNTNLLWVNRDEGIHWGDDFYLTTTLSAGGQSVQLKLKLYGEWIGSSIWASASGPGFSHPWYDDRNFHTADFSLAGKQYRLKYTFYFTGGNDDILYSIEEVNPYPAPAADANDPDVLNVMAYNVYMLTPPIALSDQGTRAYYIDDAVHGMDALLIQEAFDNSARATLLAQLANEYPYQTSVVDLPNLLEDGGILIVSKWPIETEAQLVWDNCDVPDCLANKGIKYARINKLGKRYHLFSTHQQAFNSNENVLTRIEQMQTFNNFINSLQIPANEGVIFGGDMNVDKHTNKLGEYDAMLSIFNAPEPDYLGHPNSWDKYYNYYIGSGSEEPEYLDYVLTSANYRPVVSGTNEVRILRSQSNDMWGKFDLSDHFAVVGRYEFEEDVVTDPCLNVVIAAQGTVTDESIQGAADGAIDLSVTGGTGSYSFNWSGGQTTEDLTGLAPGTYSVTVTDGNGCTGSWSGTVQAGTPPATDPTVDWQDFRAEERRGKLNLKWTAIRQTDNALWSVYESTDAVSWTLVGTVAGYGPGTTRKKMNYSVRDNSYPNALAYYRLTQTTTSGTEIVLDHTTFTPGAKLEFMDDQEIVYGLTAVYPNPVSDRLTLEYFAEEGASRLSLRILGLDGREWLSGDFALASGHNQLALDLAGLPAGIYVVQGNDDANVQSYLKVVKQ